MGGLKLDDKLRMLEHGSGPYTTSYQSPLACSVPLLHVYIKNTVTTPIFDTLGSVERNKPSPDENGEKMPALFTLGSHLSDKMQDVEIPNNVPVVRPCSSLSLSSLSSVHLSSVHSGTKSQILSTALPDKNVVGRVRRSTRKSTNSYALAS